MTNPWGKYAGVAVSDEVRTAVGDAIVNAYVTRLRSSGDYQCSICNRAGDLDAGDSAAVVIYRHLSMPSPWIRPAHRRCSPSTIIELDRPPSFEPPEAVDVLTLTAVLPGSDGALQPTLFLDRTGGAAGITGPGDVIDLWLAQRLESGWQSFTGHEAPSFVPGHVLEVDLGQPNGRVVMPDGDLLLDQLDDAEPRWFQAAVAHSSIIMFCGELHLKQYSMAPGLETLRDLMATSIERASVVVGRVAVTVA